MKTLMRTRFGSHLYGTSTPASDTDYKAIHIPPAYDILMQRVEDVVSRSTGDNKSKNASDDIDDDSFSLGKLFKMLHAGDMIAYELLFVNENQAEIWTEEWDRIHSHRKYFIDRNIKGFIGYIRKQVNKYGVKGSRVATARESARLFKYFAALKSNNLRVGEIPLGVLERLVLSQDHCSLIEMPINPKQPNVMVPFIEILNRKIDFRITVHEAYKIVNRLFEEYGARALAAENNQGVDWKAVYHAVRVSEQALELTETGEITFPRQNVEDLLKIRRGERSFKEVAEQLENNLNLLEVSIETTTHLNDSIDSALMNRYIEKNYLKQIRDYYRI